MLKKISSLLLLVGCLQTQAQLSEGLQGAYIPPGGDLKYTLKLTVGIELKFNGGDIDKRLKLGSDKIKNKNGVSPKVE